MAFLQKVLEKMNEWRNCVKGTQLFFIAVLRRMAGFSSSFPGFLQVLVDKFLIKCQAVWVCNSWRFCRKVTSLNSWIVSICCCDGVFTFLCIFQVVLGYSLDASPELVNQAYIVNAHVLEISPRGRSFHQIYQNYLKLLLKGFFLIIE